MSAAQLQIILSSPESFAGLLGQTLSADNATRKGAEDLYAQLKKKQPDACATNLMHLTRVSPDMRIRTTCAVYLRKFFKSGAKEAGWQQLSRTTKSVLKRELLAALGSEAARSVVTQVAELVVELGDRVLAEAAGAGAAEGGDEAEAGGAQRGTKRGRRVRNKPLRDAGWPELLGALQGWLQAGQPLATESALQVVAGLAVHLRPWSEQLAPVVGGCLGPQHGPEVQVAAVKAVAAFLEVLRKPSELRAFQPALAAALTALQGALAAGHAEAAEHLLVQLIRTAEVEPGLWQPHLRAAVPGMLTLAGAGPAGQPLPEDLRRMAAEFVLTLVDVKPQLVQEELGAVPLASQLVSCLALFLTEGIEDEPGWGADPMAPPDMDEDDTLGELHRYGLECSLRAAESLDSAAVLRAVVEMSAAWARDGSDWRRRHAVLMILSQVVGSCKEVVGPTELASLASLMAEALRDPHPRVRWAACHAAGVLSDDLGPRLQLEGAGAVQGGVAVLTALTELLAEPEGPACPQRVKAQACRALVGFLDGMEDPEAEGQEEEDTEAEGARAAASAAARERLLAPFLQPLSVPLLANVERCAAGEGGAVPGGRALVPTPLQESSIDVLTHLANRLGAAFSPLFPAAMGPVLAVLARAAPFHPESAVASGAVTEEEATAIVRVQVGALECAAFMCRAAGAAAALPHLPSLAAQLGLLARPDLTPDSRLLVPLLGAVEPLATCLGPEARHLLGPMLPLLAQWAARDVGLRVDDDENEEADVEGDGASEAASGSPSSDSSSDGSDRDDSDVGYLSYGGVSYRYSASALAAKAAAVSSLDELVDRMGPAIAQQAHIVADALVPRLLEYPLEEVHTNARRAVPKLVRSYLAALVTHGSLPPADPAASPAAAQALLHRVWQAVTTVIHGHQQQHQQGNASGGAGMEEGAGAGRPAPTVATRADMVEVLTSIVDGVEGPMLQEAWVAEAFGAMQAALAAAQQEAQEAGSDGEDEEEDKSMEEDGSEDLGSSGSEAEDDQEEEEEAEEEEEDAGEAEEDVKAACERLRSQVEACVAAFTRKYGGAVAALAQQVLLAAQEGSQQGALAVGAVKTGVVA